MRLLLRSTRRMCREEEDIMADFNGVKATIDTNPRNHKLLKLGGKLTDIRRKQQRLAGQVEELQV